MISINPGSESLRAPQHGKFYQWICQ